MKRYKNTSGDAGVVAFEIGPAWIKIKFQDGSVYLYTNQSTGSEHISEMQRLAERGRGLTTYINRFVRENYAKKLR